MLRALSDRLFVREEPLRFLGVEIGRICTVVRLSGGGLLVHSPARLTLAFERALDALGDVRPPQILFLSLFVSLIRVVEDPGSVTERKPHRYRLRKPSSVPTSSKRDWPVPSVCCL